MRIGSFDVGRQAGHGFGPGGVVDLHHDVVGRLLQLGAVQLGQDPSEQRQDLGPMDPPGEAERLAQSRGREVLRRRPR